MTLDIQFASSANPCSYYGNISIGDKIEMIKRYYTWTSMPGYPSTVISEKLFSDFMPFLNGKGVSLMCNMPSFKKELAAIGVHLINEQYNVQEFTFNTENDSEADSIESEIKHFAESVGVKLYSVKANLDYDVICRKITDGKLILTEEVLGIEALSNLEKRIYTYVDQLNAAGKRLILTDPFLFISSDANYINTLTGILVRTKAVEFICYMPQSQFNRNYRKISKNLKYARFVFKKYDNCHDRFWLCPDTNKGFYLGTSLNGVGKKLCKIDMLKEDEVLYLLSELK